MPKRPPNDPLGPYVPLENAGKSGAARSRNPFDPENLRLNDAYTFGVPEAVSQTFVPLEKPHNKDFVRVNPDPAYQLCTLLIVAPGATKDLLCLRRAARQSGPPRQAGRCRRITRARRRGGGQL
jgi:hypothetical protein